MSEGVLHEQPTTVFTEAQLETYTLELLGECGWEHIPGSAVGPAYDVRKGWGDLVLYPRLRTFIATRYPKLSDTAVNQAVGALLDQSTRNDLRENHRFHERLRDGVSVTVKDSATGVERSERVRPVDFGDPYANDLIVVSQVRVVSSRDRAFVFDLVLYVNGLPLAVIELKRANSSESIRTAYEQIQGYRRELKDTGTFATILVALVSDGIAARVGTPLTPWEHMAPWNADEHGVLLRKDARQDGRGLERMVHGALEPAHFLDLIASFLSYSAEESGAVNSVKLAKAHQYLAVNEAVHATEVAIATDGRAGIVWHTQGAGKSEEMLFYVGKAAQTPELANPTFVLLTDRIDLDNQLFQTFAASRTLRQTVGQVEKVEDGSRLRELLTRREGSGGVVFTTLQKFRLSKEEREAGARHPLVSPRRDIIVVVDEAHRSHYDFIDGYARNLRDALPHATFIAFTGTPIDNTTGSTQAVFGRQIHKYDLTQAVDDGATVPVYYEPKLTRLDLPDVDLDDLDARAEGLVDRLTDEEQRKAQRLLASYESLIGAPQRLEELAKDVVAHWEVRRQEMIKLTGRPGKGMIVASSRAIAARTFEAIARLRPDWVGERDPKTGLLKDNSGRIRVVYTGNPAKDAAEVAEYVRTPQQLKEIQQRVVDPEDKLELVIVQNLWLTGFDAPPLHTLYLDRRMRGAALMQAIARVNRTWGAKPAGLVVDFQGVADHLSAALAEYSDDDQTERPLGASLFEAVKAVRENHKRLTELLRDCPWQEVRDGGGRRAYPEAVSGVLEFLAVPEPTLLPGAATRRQRFMHWTNLLRRAFSLCPMDERVQDLVPEIRFFETVWASRRRLTEEARAEEGLVTTADLSVLIEQLNASAVAADGVVDIYEAAGLTKPDLSHLDENFLAQLRASRRPNLAIEALRRTVMKEIRDANPGNITRQQTFTRKMAEAMNRYANGLVSTAEIMRFLVEFAQEVSADRQRAERLELSDDELAFYDAVAANPSAVEEMGEGVLADIARELYRQVKQDVTVDWKLKEQARDRIKARVKRLLRRFGYPPDGQPEAIERVLKQTEEKAESWS